MGKEDFNCLVDIADKAAVEMESWGKEEYELVSIEWIESRDHWMVKFYSDYGNPYTDVFVKYSNDNSSGKAEQLWVVGSQMGDDPE